MTKATIAPSMSTRGLILILKMKDQVKSCQTRVLNSGGLSTVLPI